jgi:error-prone DNA polymerase
VRETGGDVDLARLPPDDPAVYRSLQEADTIGVFQVESRAQMATLPRVRPERFYDLVVQVAIIRPGRSWATWCIPTSGAAAAASR